MRRWRRLVVRTTLVVAVLVCGRVVAFRFSPWPAALLVRLAFERDAARANAALAEHVPATVMSRTDIRYDAADPVALLDLYTPGTGVAAPLPVVVWIHGGAWISGGKGDVANYARLLAARGFAVGSVDYAIAPGARYPTPVRQVNAALRYLRANAASLGIDADRLFLAGDSAGAQIAAQVALTVSDAAYAQSIGVFPGAPRAALRGLVLFCGPFDAMNANFTGPFADFFRTVLWSYLGTRDFVGDPRLRDLSIMPHVGTGFPPAFISVGNADPLAPHSVALAEALRTHAVETDTLFFAADYRPTLGHEYQFDLRLEASRTAFDRMVAFLTARAR